MTDLSQIPYNYQLKWNRHGSHLQGSIATLCRSDHFTDVTLVLWDGRYLSAHRFVLSSCSGYFARLLQLGAVRSSPTTVIVMPADISYRTMAILLQYMYSGEATVSNDQLNGVLRAGEVLRIKGLCREKEAEGGSTRPPSCQSATSTASAAAAGPSGSSTLDPAAGASGGGGCGSPPPRPAARPRHAASKGPATAGTVRKAVPSPAKEGSKRGGSPDLTESSASAITPEEQQTGSVTDSKTAAPASRPNSRTTPGMTPGDKRQEPRRGGGETGGCGSRASVIDHTTEEISIEESMKMELFIKEEPLDWNNDHGEEGEEGTGNSQDGSFLNAQVNIKAENLSDPECEENVYAPLTCHMCQETFKTPALWVRHIETHPATDLPRRKRRRNEDGCSSEEDEFPELCCELCEETFDSPGDWVRHIQGEHTEGQLALANSAPTSRASHRTGRGSAGATSSRTGCPSCPKTFPSLASMLIHSRTHTGEQPYICHFCAKGFNVKSNLLRHLRTLHDHLIAPDEAEFRRRAVS